MDGFGFLYAVIKHGNSGVCANAACAGTAIVGHSGALSEYMYACYDFSGDDVRADPDGWRSEETAVVGKRRVSPCTLPDTIYHQLYCD